MDNEIVDLISLYKEKMIPVIIPINVRDAKPGDIMVVTAKHGGHFDLGSYEIVSRQEQNLHYPISICSDCITREGKSCVYYIAKLNEYNPDYNTHGTAVSCNSVFNVVRKSDT